MNAAQLYRKQGIWIHLPLWLVAFALFFILSMRWMPMPPTEITFTAGQEGAGYYAYAQRYAAILQERGIEVKVLQSEGTGTNIARLQASPPQAEVGMIQGGYAMKSGAMRSSSIDIETIAQVYVEPVWVFSRFNSLDNLAKLQGLRVAIGQSNSGSRAVALQLLEQHRIEPRDLLLTESIRFEAATALKEDRIDALIMVAGVDSPVIQKLLTTPGVFLAHLKKSAALSERMPYLDGRFLAKGSLNNTLNVPPQDMTLLTTQAALVVNKNTHPMIKRALAAAALELHSGAGPLHRTGEYPNLKRLEFPSSLEARSVLRAGLPWLEQKLSGNAAQWVYRLLFIGLPLIFIAVILSRSIPAYLRWRIESSINRWYGELKFIENDLLVHKPGGLEMVKFRTQLRAIETQILQFQAPKFYMQRVYMLRKHVIFVREQLLAKYGR